MAVIENTYRDKVFIEFRLDIPLPHPNGVDLMWMPAQSQLCWIRKVVGNPTCNSCGGVLESVEYQATGRVGEAPFGFILVVPAKFVVETTTKRTPNPCTNLHDDQRGIDVNDRLPPHLREGIEW